MKISSLRYSIMLICFLFGFSILALPASANPVVLDPIGEWSMLSFWVLIMVAANFPLNLFFYLIAMLMSTKKWGITLGNFPRNSRTFVTLILFAVFFISLVGAGIDWIFIIQVFGYISDNYLFLFLVGIISIFLSVYLVSTRVLQMKNQPAFVAGVLLALVNPVFWLFPFRDYGLIFGGIIGFLLPLIFLVLAIIAILFLLSWRKKIEIPIEDQEMISRYEDYHKRRAKVYAIIILLILTIFTVPIVVTLFY